VFSDYFAEEVGQLCLLLFLFHLPRICPAAVFDILPKMVKSHYVNGAHDSTPSERKPPKFVSQGDDDSSRIALPKLQGYLMTLVTFAPASKSGKIKIVWLASQSFEGPPLSIA
jgi:hypothetical protein